MDLAKLTAKAQTVMAEASDFDKSVKFDFGDMGKLLLDGGKGTATNEDADTDATMQLNWEDFIKLAKGDLDPTMAFMSGKVKVLGDMSAIMKLQDLVKRFL